MRSRSWPTHPRSAESGPQSSRPGRRPAGWPAQVIQWRFAPRQAIATRRQPAPKKVFGGLFNEAPVRSRVFRVKFGEIIGPAVRDATVEALRWQNGLEASYTRSFFHALGRYGLTEQTVLESLKCLLDAGDFELLKKNSKSVFYEPHVGVSAHAIAVILDRVRHGSLPATCARDALVQQAAILAANLAAKPDQWSEYYRLLQSASDDPRSLVTAAIALGWREKWRRG
jgi:hypothetical protein